MINVVLRRGGICRCNRPERTATASSRMHVVDVTESTDTELECISSYADCGPCIAGCLVMALVPAGPSSRPFLGILGNRDQPGQAGRAGQARHPATALIPLSTILGADLPSLGPLIYLPAPPKRPASYTPHTNPLRRPFSRTSRIPYRLARLFMLLFIYIPPYPTGSDSETDNQMAGVDGPASTLPTAYVVFGVEPFLVTHSTSHYHHVECYEAASAGRSRDVLCITKYRARGNRKSHLISSHLSLLPPAVIS
ncbi:hypothetical protein F4861DRAFT_179534 [Xylaria intraflava]|nr:hypothetical protein F4861DRAFT_179534 [Xylaria intraflava]